MEHGLKNGNRAIMIEEKIVEELQLLASRPECALYEIDPVTESGLRRFVASTPGTRQICNDPFVVGVDYTRKLQVACTEVLKSLRMLNLSFFTEAQTCVLHVLRGGLNFGLRDAFADAFSWNRHCAAFISAQRARSSQDPEDWYITESEYQKIYLPHRASIVLGDVVATGTSLQFALRELQAVVEKQGTEISSILFFTIGGARSEKIIEEIHQLCKAKFSGYQGASVVYFEGRFTVANETTPVSVKLTGTDLLRKSSLLAHEFVKSQYESPSFPLERCAIYDAGSRAFWLPEYFEDIKDYWEKTTSLAEKGMSFGDLLAERFPELNPRYFNPVNLRKLCKQQLNKANAAIKAFE